MALYVGTSYKQMVDSPEEVWSNVYTLDSSNIVTAMGNLDDISDREANVMGETARVFRLHVIAQVGGTGIIQSVDKVGVQPVADPATLLPLWNVVKVTFTSDQGRPEIKYLRLPLYADMVEGLNISNAVQTTVQLDYAAQLIGIPQYTGPNGEEHTGATVQNAIQMRQTNWHRRTRPGFKRGWVPV